MRAADFEGFLGWVSMIEFENDGINFSAVDTGMGSEIRQDVGAILTVLMPAARADIRRPQFGSVVSFWACLLLLVVVLERRPP